MTSFKDLPDLALNRIEQLVRPRIILGTNKYARVCRRWREASSNSSSEDLDPLQLFLDLRQMAPEDSSQASSWMAMHGQHVAALVIEAWTAEAQRLYWLPAAAAGLMRLRRVEVHHEHSLALLAPALRQLPQLQHLEASVAVRCAPSEQVHVQEGALPEGAVLDSVFLNQHGAVLEDVPDLHQLCPQLTTLHLHMEEVESEWCGRHVDLQPDARLPRLLPAGLQELKLRLSYTYCKRWVVHSTSLVHLTALQRLMLDYMRLSMQEEGALAPLTALQQLTLHMVEGHGPGLATLAQDLSSLQQLRILEPASIADSESIVQQLESKVVEYHPWAEDWAAAATRFVRLTQLAFTIASASVGGDPGVLAALSCLQELRLHCTFWGDDGLTLPLVQQAAGMSQLRSLQLDGFTARGAELSTCLAQCTQLTSLVLTMSSIIGYVRSANCPWPAALRHLTGLRRLEVPSEVLQQEEGTWLAPLGALTYLCIELPPWCAPRDFEGTYEAELQLRRQWRDAQYPMAQQLLQQVQEWPASVQQVVLGFSDMVDGFVMPRCWQHTLPGPEARQFAVWLEGDFVLHSFWVAQHWARPFSPCPHLAGVWELQGKDEDRQ